ncbi:glycerol-3-phosphate 1-O-acyltransferase PlsY [Peribacillus sp. SCS-155]|uniref:glycerol-3-phosphate 1-O-acyltransferase PlsY n=1 Tax=Peribacillus sedimenti TaxID=3115297 RepID=UPI0039064F1D
MLLFIILLAYILGSIPFALMIGKLFFGVDIRDHGSGNPGATNSVRVLGKKAGLLVFAGDALKGFAAASLPIAFHVDADPLFIGFVAVAAHCFPIFAGFKGGKAVATTFGVLLYADLELLAVALGSFVAIILFTKYVALGSLSIAPSLLLYSLLDGSLYQSLLFMAFIPFMFFVHRSNIRNLRDGNEPKINDKTIKNDKITKDSNKNTDIKT